MWRWDQGRLPYFQFDNLRAIARLALAHDLKSVDKAVAKSETKLSFPPDSYPKLWRNYSRTLKLALLVYDDGDRAVPTPVAATLAKDGAATADEYFHFIARSFTDPSPVSQDWNFQSRLRYPLAFSLRYCLAKVAERNETKLALGEILQAYRASDFCGTEEYSEFVSLVDANPTASNPKIAPRSRQARESLKVIAQISYLHHEKSGLGLALDKRDAKEMFDLLQPLQGSPQQDAEGELRRISDLARNNMAGQLHELKNTVV